MKADIWGIGSNPLLQMYLLDVIKVTELSHIRASSYKKRPQFVWSGFSLQHFIKYISLH